MAIENLHQALKEQFTSGVYSDLEVRCGSLVVKVHKTIVCSQSDWFSMAIDSERFLEGSTGVIEIKDQNPDAVNTMLEYLYTGGCNWPIELNERQGELMLFHLDVYAVADLIQHQNLKERVEICFKNVVKQSYTDTLFPAVVRKTYEVSPPGSHGEVLRGIIVDTVAKHAGKICSTHAEFEATVEQLPAFGVKLALAIIRSHQEPLWAYGRALQCPGCRKVTYVTQDSELTEECPHNCDHRDTWNHELTPVFGRSLPRTYQCSGPERHRFATNKEPEICYACEASVELLRH